MRHLRWLERWLTAPAGYFWLPCPLCGQYFSGREWRDQDGKSSIIADPRPYDGPGRRGIGICPDCTRAGKGEPSLRGPS